MRWFSVKLMQERIIIDALQDTRKLFATENTDDCRDRYLLLQYLH